MRTDKEVCRPNRPVKTLAMMIRGTEATIKQVLLSNSRSPDPGS